MEDYPWGLDSIVKIVVSLANQSRIPWHPYGFWMGLRGALGRKMHDCHLYFASAVGQKTLQRDAICLESHSKLRSDPNHREGGIQALEDALANIKSTAKVHTAKQATSSAKKTTRT